MYRFRLLVQRVEVVEVELEAETLDGALSKVGQGEGKVLETRERRVQSQCCLDRQIIED
jgi:hypothetical protein